MKAEPQPLRLDQPAVYQIRVQGRLDASWSAWFDNLAISVLVDEHGFPVTLLAGPVRDQVALHGLFVRIRDLGLPILLVQYIPDKEDSYDD